MKLRYYPDTDSLYIDLAERPSVDSREIAPGIVLDFDATGALVGIDIDQASHHLDRSGGKSRERTGGDGAVDLGQFADSNCP